MCKMGLTSLHDFEILRFVKFVLCWVTRPFCRFTHVYEGHFMLCYKEEFKSRVEPSDCAMANFKG